MKKKVVLLCAAVMSLSLVACGTTNTNTNDGNNQNNTVTEQPTQNESTIAGSIEILNTVWDSYAEDDKFSVAGGDMTEENMTMDGPGIYGIDDADMLDNALGFPAADIDMIDGAASLVHMMNANTFTCGVYHVTDAANIDTIAADLKANVMARQWMCGFPDVLVVASIEDYVVAFFGENEIVGNFKDNLTAAYPSAVIISEDPIE